MPLIATHSGLRGRPGVELSNAVVAGTVTRFLAELDARGLPRALGVARDGRAGGEALARAVVDAAVAHGAEVADFGVVVTPAAKLGARTLGLAGAVIVTGSHLGPEWNGLKLVAGPDYLPFDVRALPEEPVGPRPGGRVRACPEVAARHVDAVVASVDAEAIRRAAPRVSVSGGAGAGTLLLERLGCRPGPGPALELDADGDRLDLVDERDVRLGAEATLPLVARASGARTVVKGADTSRIVDQVVDSVHVVPPGELNLLRALIETGADLAGEGNGGVVVPGVVLARDALAAAAQVLGLCVRAGLPLSELAAQLPRSEVVRSVLTCERSATARSVLEEVNRRLGAPNGALDPHDGVRVEREPGVWGLVRLSATEPVLRITAEAADAASAKALHAELRAVAAAL